MEQVVPEGFILNKGRGPYTTHNGPFYINASVDPWLHGTFIIERHCNGAQIAHGGMLMSFADGICGHAVYKATKTAGVTIKLNSEFLSAARPGEWLEGYAIVNSQKDDFVFIFVLELYGLNPVFNVSILKFGLFTEFKGPK